MDEPTQMPEGTVLTLVVDDEGDDLGEADRAALHDVIDASRASLNAGGGRDAQALIDALRAGR